MTIKRVNLQIEQSSGDTQNVGFDLNFGDLTGPQGPQGPQGEKGDTGPQGPAGSAASLTGVKSWANAKIVDLGSTTLDKYNAAVAENIPLSDITALAKITVPTVVQGQLSVDASRLAAAGAMGAGKTAAGAGVGTRVFPLGDSKFILEGYGITDAVPAEGAPTLRTSSAQYIDLTSPSAPVALELFDYSIPLMASQSYVPRVNFAAQSPVGSNEDVFEGDVFLDTANKKVWVFDKGAWVDTAIGTTSLVSKATSTNLSVNYPDDVKGPIAAGMLGKGCYMKTTLTAYGMHAGRAQFNLTEIPCKEDGTPLPYNVNLSYPNVASGAEIDVAIFVSFQEVPLYKLDLSTKKITALSQPYDAAVKPIPAIPDAAQGVTAQELHGTLSYIGQ